MTSTFLFCTLTRRIRPEGQPSLPGLRAFRIDRGRQKAGKVIGTECQSAVYSRFDADSWAPPRQPKNGSYELVSLLSRPTQEIKE